MMEGDIERLRLSAASWSLAGDSQLLDILQNLHQSIISKCQDTNSQLESMMTSLDNASIDLQNVNNKFLGLSNSQFVESRVFDDNTDIAPNDDNKVPPKPAPLSPISSLKLGLQTLESLHEPVPVLDSDSDDDESSARVVLRPLIRRTTHSAHEVISSDSGSEDSYKGETHLVEEYSDSEPDEQTDIQEHTPSSSVTSHARVDEQTIQPPPIIPAPELEESPKTRKLYTVEKPITAQIFPDEPPPLDKLESESDDDIFADLHKQPYHLSKEENVVEDLFGQDCIKDDDIGNIVSDPVVREKSPVFIRHLEPELKQAAMVPPVQKTNKDEGVKKPVGGISLFGAKGSESIGAAILKRTQRQSSSESDVTDTQTKQTNIIDDLFTKPVKSIKKGPANVKKESVVAKHIIKDKVDSEKIHNTEKKDKIDLFSDNIFDDIDDIFTSNVITKTKGNEKSLFDDDLFDKDNDNLFNDKRKPEKINKMEGKKNKVKSIFDSDSEDDLFSDIKVNKDLETKIDTSKVINDNKLTINYLNDKDSLTSKENKTEIKTDLKKQLSPNIFGDDDDDLFTVTPIKEYSEKKSETIGHDDIFGEEIQDKKQDFYEKETKNDEVKVTHSEENVLLEKEEVSALVDKGNVIKPDNIDVNKLSNESNHDYNYYESTKEDITKTIDTKMDVKDNVIPSLPEIDSTQETEDIISNDTIRDAQDIQSKDIFVDIFSDLPPAFEKPVEPKKSKNVNALFDDDSDDEALFFKKDDVITDEKPEIEVNNDRFRIFHDEPPDIDVDFSQKSRNTENIPDFLATPEQETTSKMENFLDKEDKEESSVLEVERLTESVTNDEYTQNMDNGTTSSLKKEHTIKIDIFKLLESEKDDIFEDKNKALTDTENNDFNIETKKEVKEVRKEESDSSESEKRPIGKLKPMNLNINVNTLLPGAVPKKPTIIEETDGHASSKTKDDISIVEESRVKAVSFKGEPDSGVLDNKLSKDRAKIQVKRRPSTRRARLEAVRKSGIDFGSDSTDNSSSFDEPTKNKPKKDNDHKETKPIENKVTSKVVYILNDEDIFDIPCGTTSTDNEDLFKQVNTLGNTYKAQKEPQTTLFEKKEVTEIKAKKSLFDDSSDDETKLFKKPTKKLIFDSDSENELFTKDKGKSEPIKTKHKETKVEQKAKEIKTDKKVTLFSDDSDEDLFGGNTKKYDIKTRSKPKPTSNTSQTFDDPLTMLTDNTK